MPGFKFSNRTAEEREELFISLYKNAFPTVARYVSKMGGTFDEAKDIFQDALVVYYEKSVDCSFELKTNEKAYLLGIAKHLWLKQHRDNSKLAPLNDLEIKNEVTEHASDKKILSFLQMAGKKCMDLLRSFYYDGLQLADAAELFGFSGVRSATVQKYKCLEKVRETVKQKALTYEDFVD
ncbi:RNA polymerase sigma factor [Mucilaginibacter sp. BT774]|uniref:RNA polymerase sigma factor n=1 Tax=Mucilaginibacter sp. BT774 TaxID=3062276 RepID=UPI002675D16A|nr:sigma-70 family RNA polymerase sigma factor [Mucilaginibacter sp. BT774]MDO3624881.1 sigma-70 family RNA polymerase sigma factor [Mucilaginibacter sp. BT774]